MKNMNFWMVGLVSTALVFGSCKKAEEEAPAPDTSQEVVQSQNSLIVEPTATWCGPCGTYGKPATDGVISGNNVVGIYAHLKAPASDLGAQVGQDLAVMVGAANASGSSYSIPKIMVGDNVTGAYTSIDYTKNILNGWISTINSAKSKVNSKISVTDNGNTLNITTNTKFFEGGMANNQYKISLIVTEDGISNRQNHNSGGYMTVTHNHVARASAGLTEGEDLHALAAIPAAGKIISKNHVITVDPKWKKANLTVIAIIWRYEGTKRYFVNVDKLDLN